MHREAMKTILKVAAVLLVAGLSGQSALAANGCLAGIKSLLCGHPARNYEILAEHLYQATILVNLADNTAAAESLLSKHPNAGKHLTELVNAFKSLKGRESGPEVMCGRENLANLRRVAEATRAAGSLGAGKKTQPVRQLNTIIIGLIAYARSVCPSRLDDRWPKLWDPKFTHGDMKYHVEQLARNVESLPNQGNASERHKWASELSTALQEDVSHDLYAGRNIGLECRYPIFTTKEAILAKQLRQYVYGPCREFVDLRETRDVLEPYGDLLMSWHAIKEFLDSGQLERIELYYDNNNYNRRIRRLAHTYETCQRILAMPEKVVARQVRKSREPTSS